MAEPFAAMLATGRPKSLGRSGEVVALTLADRGRLEELLGCVTGSDELVRMRAGDALEKVSSEEPEWLVPHLDLLLGEVAAIDQPSVRWHLAQMLGRLHDEMTARQREKARGILQRNLLECDDWIVLGHTIDALGVFAGSDPELATWLLPGLERLSGDPRKAVAKRAAKRLAELEERGR